MNPTKNYIDENGVYHNVQNLTLTQIFDLGAEHGYRVAKRETVPLTDIEKRIFLSAMSKEEKVAKDLDEKMSDDEFGGSDINLFNVCKCIERKIIHSDLWREKNE